MRISDWSSDVCSSDLRTPEREAAVKIMIYGGAAGAVVAALFGWIHTGPWFGGDTVMQLHRWNGMLIAALGMVAAWIAFRNPQSRGALRLTLFPITALLIAPGYMGGELAQDRKSVVSGKSVSVRVDIGGRRNIKQKRKQIIYTKSDS